MSRFLLFAPLFALICLFPVDESYPRSPCYLVDGKALCGKEGDLARQAEEKIIKDKMVMLSRNLNEMQSRNLFMLLP